MGSRNANRSKASLGTKWRVPKSQEAAFEGALYAFSGRINAAPRGLGSLADRQSSLIKQAAYSLGKRFTAKDEERYLEKYIADRLGRRVPRTGFSENRFLWIIKLIVDEEDLDVYRQYVAKWAAELLYAAQHRIPCELLIGFIAQSGGSVRIMSQLRRKRTEMWFPSYLEWLEQRG